MLDAVDLQNIKDYLAADEQNIPAIQARVVAKTPGDLQHIEDHLRTRFALVSKDFASVVKWIGPTVGLALIAAIWGAVVFGMKTEAVAVAEKQAKEFRDNTEKLYHEANDTLVAIRKSKADAEQAVAASKDNYVGIKKGTILPYCGKELPDDRFWWADGDPKHLWPKEEWVPRELQGKRIPNLNGRVLRGVGEENLLCQAGGSDRVQSHFTDEDGTHSHAVKDHMHNLGGYTGGIGGQGATLDELTEQEYWLYRNNGSLNGNEVRKGVRSVVYFTNDHSLATVDNDGTKKPGGNHRHNMPATTGGSSSAVTTEADGQHKHKISEVEYIPAHVAVRYIIRWK
ncbi:MAG TPA: hypothetical protein VG055_00150 [Planctomycetaceae bacterium]|jgi:hypothetical protein|nr:hypothetical protein [Planctomycetaceae bacterium]